MNEIDEIKARLDIVDIVGQYVQLQRAGRSHKAICPFHSEKTPSFTVSPDRGTWHCFGACGTGGDVFSFVMKKEGIEFGEALRMLAARAGVALPERRRRPEEDRARERSHAANETAAHWYHELLVGSEAAKDAWEYVQKRGIDRPTAEAFLLGYSPPSWEATREQLRERGFSDAELLAAGLLVEGGTGLHDRFRGRLMFPIRDARGRFAGFGARALDDSMPKYLNTAQTPVFDKGGMLYALERAQDGIRREGCAVVVEGYMDVIAAHQLGFENVVATMGTSLTERQVRLLKRQTRDIVLALDADAAGSEAALRGHEVVEHALSEPGEQEETIPTVTFWRGLVRCQEVASVDLRIAALPEGRDPDDVIRSDPDAWRELIASARPVLDHRFDAAKAKFDLSHPRQRAAAVEELLPLLASLKTPVMRDEYVRRLSTLAAVGEKDVAAMVAEARRNRRRPTRAGTPEPMAGAPTLEDMRGDTRREAFLLALLLRFPHLREAGLGIPEDLLWESANREVLSAWKRSPESDTVKEALSEELMAHLERLIAWRLPEFPAKQAEEALQDCRERLERRHVEAERRAIGALLAAREEDIGASALVEAAVSDTETEDETVKEAVSLHRRDLETGLKLHARERKEEGGEPAYEQAGPPNQ